MPPFGDAKQVCKCELPVSRIGETVARVSNVFRLVDKTNMRKLMVKPAPILGQFAVHKPEAIMVIRLNGRVALLKIRDASRKERCRDVRKSERPGVVCVRFTNGDPLISQGAAYPASGIAVFRKVDFPFQ